MPHHVHLLSSRHRAALQRHFLRLDSADRRLRFGSVLSDAALRTYVQRLDFIDSDVLGVFDDRLRIIAAIHIAYDGEAAEMGISVSREARGKGIGNSLFERATNRLVNRFVRTVTMHCLRENTAVMHLARKHGMHIEREGSEADACLKLPRATPESMVSEWFVDRLAEFDYRRIVRSRSTRRILKSLRV